MPAFHFRPFFQLILRATFIVIVIFVELWPVAIAVLEAYAILPLAVTLATLAYAFLFLFQIMLKRPLLELVLN